MIKPLTALLLMCGLSACASDPAVTSMALSALAGSSSTAATQHYDCASLSPEQAQLLLDQGHTYLDPENDNIACGTLTVTSAAQAKANAAAAALYPAFPTGKATTYTSTKAASVSYSGKHYHCSDLTSAQAQALLAQGHNYLDLDGDGEACEPDARRDYATRSSGNCHWVKGYTRKDGTKVRGHQRCR